MSVNTMVLSSALRALGEIGFKYNNRVAKNITRFQEQGLIKNYAIFGAGNTASIFVCVRCFAQRT